MRHVIKAGKMGKCKQVQQGPSISKQTAGLVGCFWYAVVISYQKWSKKKTTSELLTRSWVHKAH